jgi:Ca-activated chloride channel family protein
MAWELFHFLRPAWLLLLLPAALVTWSIMRRQDPMRSWKAVIAPELLEHLAIRKEERRSRLRPVFGLAVMWLLGILALAGPSWEKEPTPFTEDQAALFIVLKVTPDMLAQDIQPSRLKRSVQKISDLLALRPGTKTGLVAYAGSAHLVMPLTADPDIIGFFAAELTPDVMPVPGDEPVQAVELAQRRLLASGLPGSIVLVADSVDPAVAAGLANAVGGPGADQGADVHILAMAAGPGVVPPPGSPAAPALDEDAMRKAAKAGGGALVLASPDDSDVRRLSARIERSIATAPTQEGERWKDAGYYLLAMGFMLALPFFRRGGAVNLAPS